jgi:hypothetical protein
VREEPQIKLHFTVNEEKPPSRQDDKDICKAHGRKPTVAKAGVKRGTVTESAREMYISTKQAYEKKVCMFNNYITVTVYNIDVCICSMGWISAKHKHQKSRESVLVTIILTHGTMLHTPRNIINTLFFIFVSTV